MVGVAAARTRCVSGLFNVGTGAARSFLDLVNAVGAAVGRVPNIRFVDTPVRASRQIPILHTGRYHEAARRRLRPAVLFTRGRCPGLCAVPRVACPIQRYEAPGDPLRPVAPVSRAGRETPTGIDRVELAYAEHLIAGERAAVLYDVDRRGPFGSTAESGCRRLRADASPGAGRQDAFPQQMWRTKRLARTLRLLTPMLRGERALRAQSRSRPTSRSISSFPTIISKSAA